MYSKSRKSNFVLDYGIQRCQITEVAFYTEVLIHNILVSLERVLDYADVGLQRLSCTIILPITLTFLKIEGKANLVMCTCELTCTHARTHRAITHK